tara:strand:- start:566 stop:910 length:345 start_codon:yes stop_codon:yes gene_type:complete
MTVAREINKKLDEILFIQSQIKEINNDLAPDAQLNDIESGEPVTKDFVLNKGREQLAQIKEELNQITNNGKNCREVFTNPYYINDTIQDKLIAEEIRANKIEACLTKQRNPNNN